MFSDFGVTVPDLPGCFSAGDTIDEALINAKEAVLTHVEGLLIDDEVIPCPSSVTGREIIWSFCEIDLAELSEKSRRVNITIPERLLTKIDSFAGSEGESRSGFLTHAVLKYISNHSMVKNLSRND